MCFFAKYPNRSTLMGAGGSNFTPCLNYCLYDYFPIKIRNFPTILIFLFVKRLLINIFSVHWCRLGPLLLSIFGTLSLFRDICGICPYIFSILAFLHKYKQKIGAIFFVKEINKICPFLVQILGDAWNSS